MSTKRKDNKGRLLRTGEVQRADGKYMYRYTDANGDRRTEYSWKLVATDKVPDGKKCSEALRDIEKRIAYDLKDGIRKQDADGKTIDEQFRSFMELRTDLQETTRCNYMTLYNKHISPRLGHRKLSAIRSSDAQKFYLLLIQEQGLKFSTVQSVHSILYQIFEGAVADEMLRINPTESAFKKVRQVCGVTQCHRNALTEEQQERFISYIYSSPLYQRWGVLFTVLLGTGMRIGEALGLRWCDCDFEKDVIIVDHALLYKESEGGGYRYRISSPKTKAGIRIIPMFSDVKNALLKLRSEKRNPRHKQFAIDGYSDFIFLNTKGKVFTPGHVFDVIQSIVYDCNQDETVRARKEQREPLYIPKISAHILRHTFCTRICENETNIKVVQEVMGHRNIRTTMDVYNEATLIKKQASFQHMEGKFRLA